MVRLHVLAAAAAFAVLAVLPASGQDLVVDTTGAGTTPRLAVSISNTLTRDSVPQWNSVAEIRGGERPGQVVIVGAHLDSWDLGTGTTDNGTGAMCTLEEARILARSGRVEREPGAGSRERYAPWRRILPLAAPCSLLPAPCSRLVRLRQQFLEVQRPRMHRD